MLWQIVAAKVKIVTISLMRVKTLLIVLVLAIGATPVFGYLEPQQLWEYKIPKNPITLQRIWSSGGFTICYVDNSNECASSNFTLYCLDNNNGKPMWEPMTSKSSGYKIIPNTIAFQDKRMFFATATIKSLTIVCLDLEKKCEIWKTDIPVSLNPTCVTRLGGKDDKYYWLYINNKIVKVLLNENGNVTYTGNSIFVRHSVIDGRIYLENEAGTVLKCIDLATGLQLWKVEKPKGKVRFNVESECRTYISTKTETKFLQSNLVCLEPKSGKNIWSSEFEGTVTAFWADVDRVIMCLQRDNELAKVFLIQAKDGKKIWEMTLESNNSTLLAQSKILLAKVGYTCKPFQIHIYSMETGKRIWYTASNHLSMPITYENKVYYMDGERPNIRYLKRIDPEGKGFVWVIAGKINDFYSTGKMLLVAEDEKITCYGDANP